MRIFRFLHLIREEKTGPYTPQTTQYLAIQAFTHAYRVLETPAHSFLA